jgi:hypothetical protein
MFDQNHIWCNINIPVNFVFLGEDAVNKSLTLRQRIIVATIQKEDQAKIWLLVEEEKIAKIWGFSQK